ncbi:MAG: hypothetical protein WBP59_00450 [Ilumatobacteraceae bacterium]
MNATDPSGIGNVSASANFGTISGGGSSCSFEVNDGAVSGGPTTATITIVATDGLGNSWQTSTNITVSDADECCG